jgi:hypothetical protein
MTQRDPRQRDPAYLAWLHRGIPCIACVAYGFPLGHGETWFAIEAAHQNLPIASKGWSGRGLGKRTHDARAVPLCAWHHRLSPNACDNGQRAFWDRLGLGDDVADFAAELHAAYTAGAPGRPVVERWAERAWRA